MWQTLMPYLTPRAPGGKVGARRQTVRGAIWGIIAGVIIAVAGGHAVAFWNHEWPFYRNKVASHAAIDFTRTIGVPCGAILGGIGGALIRAARGKRSRSA